MSPNESIEIIPVNNRSRLNRFINLPWALYREDPHWVPPLKLERKLHLASNNPYFQHCRWQAWLAVKNGRDAGRISAQVDQLHLTTHNDDTGFFGLLESVDDAAVFQRLTETAATWLRAAGMNKIRGPFNLSINQESGLLVEGFDSAPRILMGHALPYYGQRLDELGFRKAKDLLSFEIDSQFTSPRAMQAIADKTSSIIGLRPLNRKNKKQDFKLLCDIFNDAWSENWGFVPFTDSEFEDIGNTLAFVLPDDFIQIASVRGEAAGMIVMLPDLNQILRKINGRLLPFGALKLLWLLKFRPPNHARIPLMGIRKQYRTSFIGTALAHQLIAALRTPALRTGIKRVELSWVLEDNYNLIEIIQALGGHMNKRYRVFEKPLF